MGDVKDEIAKNLLFYRKKARLTQEALAQKIGVRNNTVSQWEKGLNAVDAEVLFLICDIFEISINDMFGAYANNKNGPTAPALSADEEQLLGDYSKLSTQGKEYIRQTMEMTLSLHKEDSATQEQGSPVDKPVEMVRIYRAARSEDHKEHEIVEMEKSKWDRLKDLPRVTNIEDL